MGGVCMPETQDEHRYRHPGHGHPGMRPPPSHGHIGHYDDRGDFMNQKFRPNPTPGGFDPHHRAPPQPHRGHPQQQQQRTVPHNMAERSEQPKRHGFAGREWDHKQEQGFDKREHDMPQQTYDPHFDDRFDGYDDSAGKRGSFNPYEQDEQVRRYEQEPEPNRRHEQEEPPRRQSPYEQEPTRDAPRKKSLSDRLNNWQEKKRVEHLDLYGPEPVNHLPPVSGLDHARGDSPSFNDASQRKQSLRDRVREFKERRKLSQVRFDDESESEAQDRIEQHRDFYAVLDRQASERERHEEERHVDRDEQLMRMHDQGRQSRKNWDSDSGSRQMNWESDSGGRQSREEPRYTREELRQTRKESRQEREETREEPRKRRKKREGDGKSKKKRPSSRKNSRKESKGDAPRDRKKKSGRKTSDRKGEKGDRQKNQKKNRVKRSKEESADTKPLDRDRPRKRTFERTDDNRVLGRQFPVSNEHPHRLSQENIEIFTRKNSQGARDFDTASYQAPRARKMSSHSARSHKSAPDMRGN